MSDARQMRHGFDAGLALDRRHEIDGELARGSPAPYVTDTKAGARSCNSRSVVKSCATPSWLGWEELEGKAGRAALSQTIDDLHGGDRLPCASGRCRDRRPFIVQLHYRYCANAHQDRTMISGPVHIDMDPKRPRTVGLRRQQDRLADKKRPATIAPQGGTARSSQPLCRTARAPQGGTVHGVSRPKSSGATARGVKDGA